MDAKESFGAKPATAVGGEGRVLEEEWFTTKAGQLFNLHADRWQLDARSSVNVGALRSLIPGALADGAIRTLASDAQSLGLGSVRSDVSSLKSLFVFAADSISSTGLSLSVVVAFRQHCRERDGHERVMAGCIRPFLNRWFRLGYPGVSADLVRSMKDWRIANPEKGVAVNRLDSNKGPLMPEERFAFIAQCQSACERGDLSVEDFCAIRLLSASGRRPTQVAALKLKDFDDSRIDEENPDRPPSRLLLMHVPRAKIKGGVWRSRFRAVPLTPELWNLVAMQRQDVRERATAAIEATGLKLQPADLDTICNEFPLFPIWWSLDEALMPVRQALGSGKHGAAIETLRAVVYSDALHKEPTEWSSGAINRATAVLDVLNRDKAPLALNAYRFRYTLDYDLYRMGCPDQVRAWNLDHSSLSSLMSYEFNGAHKAEAISKAMALGLRPYAQVFLGRLVDVEGDAEGADDPDTTRLFIAGESPGGASCVLHRGCAMASIPDACYAGCPHFRPWLDGPHEQFLEMKLDERSRDLNAGCDTLIVEANDNVIMGVVNVIHLCEARRAELALQAQDTSEKRRPKRKRDDS